MLHLVVEAIVRPLDALLPCRRGLARERAELARLREEHGELAQAAARRAGRVRRALSTATIIVAVEDVGRAFGPDDRDEDRKTGGRGGP